MQKLLITAVLFVFCLGGIAQANGKDKDMDHDADIYVKGSIGIFMPEDADMSLKTEDASSDYGDISSNTGFGLTAAVGRSFGPLDLEVEYGYRESTLDEINYNDGYASFDLKTTEDLDGSLDIKTFMVNAIYNLENSTSLTPYFGVGFGGAWLDADEIHNTKLAYQLMAGVGVEVAKNTSLLLGYRYIGMGDLTGPGEIEVPSGLFADNGDALYVSHSGDNSGSVDIHNIEVGLKYSF